MIQRYNIIGWQCGPRSYPITDKDKNGEWVRAHDVDALAARCAELEKDVRRGICAAASGDMEVADAILDKHWKDRPKMPDSKPSTLWEWLKATHSPDADTRSQS